ncbi:sugar efflux transporter [Paenibacillus pabuli]|uniref:sugar efflux transporter n=1 Tax=Paenibacillus pabuli TaxID=1472 RepID=UPI001FFE6338|nr:sugar efflux transporter [Paenibacillus pabuli]UPK43313.1 sugar efflux transporter [Paenibacillus pabuli]
MKLQQFNSLFRIPAYRLFLVCMLLQGMAISISAPFLAVYFTTRLEVSIATFGIFTAITLMGGVLFSSWIARRSDQPGSRKIILVGAMICNALAFAGYLWIHEFTLLFIYMTVLTALGAPAMPQLFAAAREAVNTVSGVDHALANSTLRSAFSLGFITGPLIGTLLIAYIGYSGIFSSTCLIFLINALLFFFLLKKAPATSAIHLSAGMPVRLHQDARIYVPFLITTLLYTAHWMNNLNASLFIIHHLGGGTREVGWVSSLCAGLEIPIMLALGLLASKYPNRSLMLWGSVIGAAYYVVVLFSTEMWHLLAAQLLLAFFVAVISAIGISYMQDLLPSMPGYASTLYSNASTLGRLFGSLVGGWTAGAWGYRNAYWVCLLLVLLSLGMLVITQQFSNKKRQPVSL